MAGGGAERDVPGSSQQAAGGAPSAAAASQLEEEGEGRTSGRVAPETRHMFGGGLGEQVGEVAGGQGGFRPTVAGVAVQGLSAACQPADHY
jgi:hypothetical protein